jgi:hypothetical protein
MVSGPWKDVLISKKDFYLSYSEMKVNRSLYTKQVLQCEVHTLSSRLEN